MGQRLSSEDFEARIAAVPLILRRNPFVDGTPCTDLSTEKWLVTQRSNKCKSGRWDEIRQAASDGHLAAVEWLHISRIAKAGHPPAPLRAEGRLQLLAVSHTNRCPCCCADDPAPGLPTIWFAAFRNHLPVVEWLTLNCSDACTLDAMRIAAEKGHLKVVEWLHANHSEFCGVYCAAQRCTAMSACDAAAAGHLFLVEWLHSKLVCHHPVVGGRPMFDVDHATMINRAAGSGHLSVVEWLYTNCSMSCTVKPMDYAAE